MRARFIHSALESNSPLGKRRAVSPMASLPFPRTSRVRRLTVLIGAALALAFAGALVWAQVSGDRGIAPIASSTDIEAHGIKVNVVGDNPQDAREKGWREAMKLAWAKIGGPAIPD